MLGCIIFQLLGPNRKDRKETGRVAVDIRIRIGKLEQQLEIIGPVRQTAYEQRNNLINVASKFREITTMK